MSLVESIKKAGSGWSKILAGKDDWRAHFGFDASALNSGFVLYSGAVVFSIVCLIIRFAMPVPPVMLILLAGYMLVVVGFVVTTSIARRLLGFETPLAEIYVPGLYMLAFMTFAGGITLLLGVQLWGAIVTLAAFFLFRLARVAGNLDVAPALGYAVANFLAGLPLALYMMGGGFAVFA